MNDSMHERAASLLTEDTLLHLEKMECFDVIDSTNSYLLQQESPAVGNIRVAVADHQTAGRGRLGGRSWHSNPAAGICMSVSYRFAMTPRNLPSLTLAVGIGITKSLAALKMSGVNLKWPNDLMVDGRKVGGILTEVMAGQSDSATVVIGVGLNVDLHNINRDSTSSEWLGKATDLRSCTTQLPERPDIVAGLVNGLHGTLHQFGHAGFRPFFESWNEFDALRGKQAVIENDQQSLSGTVMGIDKQGELLLATDNGLERIVSGSVRLLEQGGMQ